MKAKVKMRRLIGRVPKKSRSRNTMVKPDESLTVPSRGPVWTMKHLLAEAGITRDIGRRMS